MCLIKSNLVITCLTRGEAIYNFSMRKNEWSGPDRTGGLDLNKSGKFSANGMFLKVNR